MAITVEKLSADVWALMNGSTNLAEVNAATNTVRLNGTVKLGTNEVTGTTLANAIAGVAQSYKVARGQHITVDEDDTVVTGLATVVSVVAVLDSDPVAGCQFVTASIGDQAGAPAAGSILIKTWKATDTADTAIIPATTFTKNVNWIAIGL
jgi:hypothetical protein